MNETLPYLSENQAPDPQTATMPSDYNPNPEDKKTIKLVYKIFERAKEHKKKYDEHSLEYYRMFRGKQWKEQRPSYRHSEVINLIFQSIQSSVPLMTDSRPQFDFLPQEPSDFEFSQIMSQVCQADWESKNWLLTETEILYEARIYGTAFGYIGFDPDAENGLGDICFERKDFFYQFPDPNATDVNKKARHYVDAEPIDVDVLKAEYPEQAKYLKADLTDLMQGDKTSLDQVRFKSPTDPKVIMEGGSSKEGLTKNKALKITLYVKPDEVIEEEKDRLDGQGMPLLNEYGVPQKEYEQKLKYPQGRKICVSNGVLLHDGPIPYEDMKFPYARLLNYVLPGEFYGISDVEQLKSPQLIFNKMVSFALDVLTLMGNPIWVVDTTSGVDVDNLFNRPGLAIEKEPGSEVRREAGVELQPYVLQMIDRMKVWFDDISGNNDVSRGATPGDVTAASAIENLQEAAKTRIRQQMRLLDAFLQDLGQMYLSRVLQFRTVPQMYRITNNQNVAQYFKFHIDNQLDETGNPMLDPAGNPMRKAMITPYAMNEMGQHVPGEVKEIPIKGKLDVRVRTGSSLPFAKKDQENRAMKLFQLGVIDDEQLLKDLDYPNAEAVLQRKAQKLQMAQMQQQAMASQGGVPGGGPSPQGGVPASPPQGAA